MHIRLLLTLGIGVLILALTACGDSSGSSPAPENSTAAAAATGPVTDIYDGMNRLYQAALAGKEKKVAVGMSAGNIPFFKEEMVPLFEKQFPGLKLEIREYDGWQMGVQIHSELSARIDTVDVVTNALIQIKPLLDAKEIDTDIDWVSLGASKARAGDLNLLHNSDGVCGAVIVNTDYVKLEELPDTLDGYTNRKFRGKMSTEPADAMACLAFYAIKYDYDTYLKLGQSLAANDLLFTPNTEQLLLSGERPIRIIAATSRVPLLQSQGAHLAIKLYPGTGMFRTRWATIKASPRPNAARLFALWATSKEFMEPWDKKFLGGSGFSGEDLTGRGMPSWLRSLGYNADDTTFFIKETANNYADRAKFSASLREAVVK